jgi:hypothetical protein
MIGVRSAHCHAVVVKGSCRPGSDTDERQLPRGLTKLKSKAQVIKHAQKHAKSEAVKARTPGRKPKVHRYGDAMSTQSTVNCSLCSNKAKVLATPNLGKYTALECSACGQFVASDAAIKRIAGLPIEFKDRWREIIRSATPDEILLIIVSPVGSGGGLKNELVQRSSLSL